MDDQEVFSYPHSSDMIMIMVSTQLFCPPAFNETHTVADINVWILFICISRLEYFITNNAAVCLEDMPPRSPLEIRINPESPDVSHDLSQVNMSVG